MLQESLLLSLPVQKHVSPRCLQHMLAKLKHSCPEYKTRSADKDIADYVLIEVHYITSAVCNYIEGSASHTCVHMMNTH